MRPQDRNPTQAADSPLLSRAGHAWEKRGEDEERCQDVPAVTSPLACLEFWTGVYMVEAVQSPMVFTVAGCPGT